MEDHRTACGRSCTSWVMVRRVNGGPRNCLRKELHELGGTVSLQDPENEGTKKTLPALPTGGVLCADFRGNGHPVLTLSSVLEITYYFIF